MFFAGNRSHAIPLFVSANVLPPPLNMINFETISSPMHDISTNSAPKPVIYLPVLPTSIHITPDFLMLVTYMSINQV